MSSQAAFILDDDHRLAFSDENVRYDYVAATTGEFVVCTGIDAERFFCTGSIEHKTFNSLCVWSFVVNANDEKTISEINKVVLENAIFWFKVNW